VRELREHRQGTGREEGKMFLMRVSQGLLEIRWGYRIFGIDVDRKHTLKWFFPQEKATFRGSQNVYVYSENALSPGVPG
jgi:hypothetical protein